MKTRLITSAALVAVFAGIASAQSGAQPKPWKAPRTADGQPDLSGIWSAATITPFERPAEFANKPTLTAEEAAAFEKLVRERNNMDNREGGAEADVARAYNDFWWDRGTKTVKSRRTSLVIDPPDGKVPALTAAAQQRQAARAEARRAHPADGPEDRALGERCILVGSGGTPIGPTAYNNNYQIVQAPGYAVILVEMAHDARIVPLDGRPHLDASVRQLKGDSRGHWEGDTLVVETTNFTGMTQYRGSGEHMKLTERFTRVDPSTLMYEFTVNDPESFTKPWTAQIPLVKTEGPIFEYACHEGNYGMTGILVGAREEEAAAAKKK